jgi:hypothetical protein
MFIYDFERARTYIYASARLLDRYLFAALFEGGSIHAVKAALSAYQNADGGFGNALEPDLRTPASQPLAVERAFMILDLIDSFDDPMVAKACDWLNIVTTAQGGLPFALPSLEGYPHAPWMQTGDPIAQVNPTAALCGILLKHHVRHPWVERASAFCWQAIPQLETDFFHEILPAIEFLQHTPDRHSEADAELQRFRGIVARPGVVALDPLASGYVKYPPDWAPTPASFLRPVFDDATLAVHLQALANRQQADGGWPINWTALSPAAEAEWRGWKTIEALLTLHAYAGLEE